VECRCLRNSDSAGCSDYQIRESQTFNNYADIIETKKTAISALPLDPEGYLAAHTSTLFDPSIPLRNVGMSVFTLSNSCFGILSVH